jgi:hypothetical protein
MEEEADITTQNHHHKACDDARGQSCAWHAKSREDTWRPDTTMHLGRDRFERVFSLTKASDVSNSFFCGLQGSIVEMNLKLAEDATGSDGMMRDAPTGWRVEAPLNRVAVVESGVSLVRENEWFQHDTGYPELYYQARHLMPLKEGQGGSISRSRHDTALRHHSEMPS